MAAWISSPGHRCPDQSKSLRLCCLPPDRRSYRRSPFHPATWPRSAHCECQGRTPGAALGSCVCTRNANGRGILNLEPSRFGVALEPLEIASKFGRGLVAQFAILLQQLADDIFQLGGV